MRCLKVVYYNCVGRSSCSHWDSVYSPHFLSFYRFKKRNEGRSDETFFISLKSPLIITSLFSCPTLTQIRGRYKKGGGGVWERQEDGRGVERKKGEITDLLKIIRRYTATWRGPGEMGIAD